jgi:phage terminase small subunit
MSGKLTPRQERFVKEYLIDLNGTQAAIRAGYSARTAKEQAFDLLTRPHIREAVEKGRARIAAKLDISVERIVNELAKIGFSNMADYMRVGGDGDPVLDFSGLDRDKSAALSEVTVDRYVEGGGDEARDVKRVKFRLHDKRAALVDLGKHLGMFTEKHEHSGEISFTFAEGDKNL